MIFKEEIRKRGLKQTWVAEQLGVTNDVLNRWLNNRANIPPKRESELKELMR